MWMPKPGSTNRFDGLATTGGNMNPNGYGTTGGNPNPNNYTPTNFTPQQTALMDQNLTGPRTGGARPSNGFGGQPGNPYPTYGGNRPGVSAPTSTTPPPGNPVLSSGGIGGGLGFGPTQSPVTPTPAPTGGGTGPTLGGPGLAPGSSPNFNNMSSVLESEGMGGFTPDPNESYASMCGMGVPPAEAAKHAINGTTPPGMPGPNAAPNSTSGELGFGPTGGSAVAPVGLDPRGNSQPFGLEHNVNSGRDNPYGVTGVTQGSQGGFSGSPEHFMTGDAARNLMANAQPKVHTAYGDLGSPPAPTVQPPQTSTNTPPPMTGGGRPSDGMGGQPGEPYPSYSGSRPGVSAPSSMLPNEFNPYQSQPQRPPAYNNPYGGGGFNSPFSNAGGFGGGGFNPFGGGGFGGGGYNPYGGGFGPRFNNMGGGYNPFGGGFGGGNPFGGGGMMNNTDQRSQMLQNLMRMFG